MSAIRFEKKGWCEVCQATHEKPCAIFHDTHDGIVEICERCIREMLALLEASK